MSSLLLFALVHEAVVTAESQVAPLTATIMFDESETCACTASDKFADEQSMLALTVTVGECTRTNALANLPNGSLLISLEPSSDGTQNTSSTKVTFFQDSQCTFGLSILTSHIFFNYTKVCDDSRSIFYDEYWIRSPITSIYLQLSQRAYTQASLRSCILNKPPPTAMVDCTPTNDCETSCGQESPSLSSIQTTQQCVSNLTLSGRSMCGSESDDVTGETSMMYSFYDQWDCQGQVQQSSTSSYYSTYVTDDYSGYSLSSETSLSIFFKCLPSNAFVNSSLKAFLRYSGTKCYLYRVITESGLHEIYVGYYVTYYRDSSCSIPTCSSSTTTMSAARQPSTSAIPKNVGSGSDHHAADSIGEDVGIAIGVLLLIAFIVIFALYKKYGASSSNARRGAQTYNSVYAQA
eukprot:m.13584 g.13584  ORF g.13584 m.13584 type:complete len:406 (+) comp10161_c0_seq2:210-1427(+)